MAIKLSINKIVSHLKSAAIIAIIGAVFILGYIFYDDVPDMFTVLGAIIITCSGIFVLNQSTKS